MALLRIDNLEHRAGMTTLFDSASLVLEPGERVALVGRNGAGKSTLLRILSGEVVADGGEFVWARDTTVATMPQEVPQAWQGTVLDILLEGLGSIGEALGQHDRAAARLATDPSDTDALARLEAAQAIVEREGGWERRRRVDEIISLLELDPAARLASLSGGQARRVVLGRALVADPDVLLLDEPTNHLDIPSIEKLETLLLRRRGTLVFISHDRALVDRLATRIVELDRGQLHSNPGSWSAFLARREERLRDEQRHAAAFDRQLAEEEAWIRQGIKARRTRNEGRVRRLQEMRRERARRREKVGTAKIQVQEAERSGRLVLEASALSFRYPGAEHDAVTSFDLTVMRGDRIGFIGPNGCGKTTLLRLLLGELEPSSGSVRHGTRLEVAYFDQLRSQLDPERMAWEVVADGNDHVTVNGGRRHVMGYLKDFLFNGDRARTPVRVLSGGERHRLLLARLFLRPSNLLVLDEPTNDLDLETLELLEEHLAEYGGTVMVVSHDRAFLNQVVTSTVAFEGPARFVEYVGGYDDWIRQRPAPEQDPATPQESGPSRPRSERETRSKVRRLTPPERRELEGLPARIETAEKALSDAQDAWAAPELYEGGDGAAAEALRAREAALQEELSLLYARWEELETIAAGEDGQGPAS
ncbi:MAG: ATP-binding cassette domain-containing protein [Deltaproteobacteria bacterium]|nr:MAG: ATP-binding cassette domain-containing protein [Deltaproteobacteria bacterium]